MKGQNAERKTRNPRTAGVLLVFLAAAMGQAAVVRQGVNFGRGQFEFSETDNYAVVTAEGMDVTSEPGRPQLPAMPFVVALPGRGAVKDVRVRAERWELLATGLSVMPAQPQVPLSVAGGLAAWDTTSVAAGRYSHRFPGEKRMAVPRHRVMSRAEPDPTVYQSNRPYPSDFWRWTGTGQKQGNTVVDLVLYPVRYVGAEERLEFCPRFRVEVEYEPVAEKPGDSPRPARSRPQSGTVPGFSWNPALFEYVIVTAGEYDSVFRRLADWKTQKGVSAVIRHIDWVYSNYAGRDNAERLRNYLRTLPDSGVKYVLLGGDAGVVPYRKAYAMKSEGYLHPREDSLPADLYFSDLDGDWDRNGNNVFGEVADSVDLYPDVFVGRAPVDRLVEAQAFVDKVLEYERGPVGGRQQNALFFAEVMWQNPYTDGGRHKDKLEALAFSGCDVTKKYQRLGNLNRTSVMQAMREGQNYLNHDGHGWIDVMSCGGWPEYLRTADADTITNDYRGVIFSIGCWTTAFDTVSIGEALVANPNGGTVATVGNSSYGWGSPGNPGFGYSDKFDDRFWWTVRRGGWIGVGAALARSKEYFAPFSRGENVYRWHQYQLNLMGCPEMPVWTAQPETFEVAAPDEIPSGRARVLVTVAGRGRAVEGALVCLMKASESYSTGRTDAAGRAWLEVEPHTSGDFALTVTAKNHQPVQRTIASGAGPYLNFAGWIVNDSLGNSDGIVNENETIRLPVWLHNAGNVPTAGIPLKLRSSDPVVEILDSTASGGSLAPGESVLVWNAFEIETRACAEDGRLLRFELAVEDTDRPRKFYPVLQLGLPVLVLKGHFYPNPPALPGRTSGVKVVVDNPGHGFGHRAWARLVSLDPNVAVLQPESILLGELAPRSRNTSDSFAVSVSSSCPGSYLADARLDLWCEQYRFERPFRLLVGNYGFSDNMEAGPAKWTHGGTGSQWHLSTTRAHSGNTAWYSGDGATRRYEPNANVWIRTTPFMVAENCTLRFWRWFSVPNYGVDGIYVIVERGPAAETLDFIGTGGALPRMPNAECRMTNAGADEDKSNVKVQEANLKMPEADGGQALDPLIPRSLDPFPLGIESDWFEERYDLGWLAPGETVQVKLGFKSDADTLVGEGFYVDDVVVTGGSPPPVFIAEPRNGPTAYGLRLTAWPNPFRTAVSLQLTAPGPAEVRIYDASGRSVRALAVGCKPSAVSSVVWNGRDDSGRRVPAGPYFIELRSGSGAQFARVVLAR